MAKGRMINRRIAKSDKLAAVPCDRSRVVYFMILPHLDVEGRYSGDPRDIKEDCCPRLPYTVEELAESLQDLHDVELLVLYIVKGKPYIEYARFEDFQAGLHRDREAKSEIPPPPPKNSGLTPEDSGGPRTKSPLSLSLNSSLSLRKKGPRQPADRPSQAKKPFEPRHYELAEYLEARIKENVPFHKFTGTNYLEAWARDFRLMEEGDKVPFDALQAVLVWSQQNKFWRRNILSAATFREKFGRLAAEMKDDGGDYKASQAGGRPPMTEEQKKFNQDREAEAKRLYAKYEPEAEKAKASRDMDKVDEIQRKFERELLKWCVEHQPEGGGR